MAAPSSKLLIISNSILNAVAVDTPGILPEHKSSHEPQGNNAKCRPNMKEAEKKAGSSKSSLERLPNETLRTIFGALVDDRENEWLHQIFGALVGNVVDEAFPTAPVCLALTSKRFAQLAVDMKITLPCRTSPDEERYNLERYEEFQLWLVTLVDPDTGVLNMILLTSFRRYVSEVQPGDYISITTVHHDLMAALQGWMPKNMLYCATCGTWKRPDKISCKRRIGARSLLPKMIFVGDGVYLCLKCHVKQSVTLHELGTDWTMRIPEVHLKVLGVRM